MNAVVHGGGGEAEVRADETRVQVWITDHGAGIQNGRTAARRRWKLGYSTKDSLGHGFWMMLRSADTVHLLTGASGTTVVITLGRRAGQRLWASRHEDPRRPRLVQRQSVRPEAAEAMADGIRRACPDAEVVLLPLADGGEGTVEALVTATGGQRFPPLSPGRSACPWKPFTDCWGRRADGGR